MASACDVAKYILKGYGLSVTSMKLQKLVYYSQAWHLVWHETPLFEEPIHAWANGPIVPSLYAELKDTFTVSFNDWALGEPGEPSLTEDEKDTIFKVNKYYGPMTAQQLSDLTHQEEPWVRARKGLSPRERGARVIEHAWMLEYYTSLAPDDGYG